MGVGTPIDPFTYHHPYQHQAAKEFTISHWYTIVLTTSLTISNSSLNHMLQHFSNISGLEDVSAGFNIETSNHRYSHNNFSVDESSNLFPQEGTETSVTSEVKFLENNSSMLNNQTILIQSLNLTRIDAGRVNKSDLSPSIAKNQENLQKNGENSNNSTSPVHDVRIGLEPMDHKSNRVPDVLLKPGSMDHKSLGWHHHTFEDEVEPRDSDDLSQMKNFALARNLTGKQLSTMILGSIGKMLHLPTRFNAKINRVSTNMYGTFFNFTFRKPLSLELHNRLLTAYHLNVGNTTVTVKVVTGPVEHLYINLEKFAPQNRFIMFLSFALGLLGVVVTIMIIIYLGAKILYVESEDSRNLIENQNEDDNELFIDEHLTKPKPQPQISFINIDSSPATSDLLMCQDSNLVLHHSSNSPSSEPVFTLPEVATMCSTTPSYVGSLNQ